MINEDNKEYCLKKEKKFILYELFAVLRFCDFNKMSQTYHFIQSVHCILKRTSRGLSIYESVSEETPE